jgi:DNA-directed RNA polymerase sigma subunit (sigma70/sigma32)
VFRAYRDPGRKGGICLARADIRRYLAQQKNSLRGFQHRLAQLSYRLTAREQQVLYGLFGVNNQAPTTNSQLALEVGVTRQRIWQLLKSGLRKLGIQQLPARFREKLVAPARDT